MQSQESLKVEEGGRVKIRKGAVMTVGRSEQCDMRRTQPTVAGFEDGGREPGDKEFGWCLQVEK